MFTVKFCSYYESGASREQSISCPNYDVYCHTDGTFVVTTFTNQTDTVGVERHVMSDEHAEKSVFEGNYFHCLYVENSAGKTIYRASSTDNRAMNLSD